jgi:hypothetical protein
VEIPWSSIRSVKAGRRKGEEFQVRGCHGVQEAETLIFAWLLLRHSGSPHNLLPSFLSLNFSWCLLPHQPQLLSHPQSYQVFIEHNILCQSLSARQASGCLGQEPRSLGFMAPKSGILNSCPKTCGGNFSYRS